MAADASRRWPERAARFSAGSTAQWPELAARSFRWLWQDEKWLRMPQGDGHTHIQHFQTHPSRDWLSLALPAVASYRVLVDTGRKNRILQQLASTNKSWFRELDTLLPRMPHICESSTPFPPATISKKIKQVKFQKRHFDHQC